MKAISHESGDVSAIPVDTLEIDIQSYHNDYGNDERNKIGPICFKKYHNVTFIVQLENISWLNSTEF